MISDECPKIICTLVLWEITNTFNILLLLEVGESCCKIIEESWFEIDKVAVLPSSGLEILSQMFEDMQVS